MKQGALSVILFLFLFLLLDPAFAREERIVGGYPAKSSYRQAVGSLYDNKLPPANEGHACAATLIRPRWALTAGHCLEYISKKRTDVVFARDDLRFPGGQKRAVLHFFLYPGYRKKSSAFDLALLHLSARPRGINPRSLRFKPPRAGKRISILGWGQTGPFSDPSSLLQEARVRVRSKKRCYPSIDRREAFCAGGRKTVCFGDSGGPAFDKAGRLVGVISRGARCGHPDYPGVYSRLDFARGWIRKTLAKKPRGPFRRAAPERRYNPLVIPPWADLGDANFSGWRTLTFDVISREEISWARVVFGEGSSFCLFSGACGLGPWELEETRDPNYPGSFVLSGTTQNRCLRFTWKISFKDQRLGTRQGKKRVCEEAR